MLPSVSIDESGGWATRAGRQLALFAVGPAFAVAVLIGWVVSIIGHVTMTLMTVVGRPVDRGETEGPRHRDVGVQPERPRAP